MLLFAAIEPEGKDGHFSVLFQSSVCLKRTKKFVFYLVPRPNLLRRRRPKSRVNMTLDRKGLKEHKLYQSL